MIVIDSRREKIKKIIVIFAIIFVLAVAWLAAGYIGKKLEERKLSQEASRISEANKPGGTISPIEEKFIEDAKACVASLSNLENMSTELVKQKEKEIVEMDIERAKSYYFCLSLKNNNNQFCDALKIDEGAYKLCQRRFSFFSQFLFSALRTGRCDAKFVDVCKNAGESDCESSCRGLILKEAGECEKIGNNPTVKSACLAINRDDANICDSLNKNDRRSCQELFYFIKAVKENNLSHLDKIERTVFRPIAQLYFDSKSSCEKILAGFGENACGKKYTREYLKTLEDQAGETQGDDVK